MKRVLLVGFGRIGRAIFRINHARPRFDIVAVNDINPEAANLAYLLKYDSTYGRLDARVEGGEDTLSVDGHVIPVHHERTMADLPIEELGVDAVIEASGVHHNVEAAAGLIERGVEKVVVTHSPDEVDHTLVFGANEDTYDPDRHHVLSSSICDAVAFAPVLRAVDEAWGVESGFLTTLHPWLAYQNLLDGPSESWAMPGRLYYHYAIGRASPGALIPKPTSAVQATERVLPGRAGRMRCMSFRIPTPVVGVANVHFHLDRPTDPDAVRALFSGLEAEQRVPVFHLNTEPTVSVDFEGCPYSAVVDGRWVEMASDRHLYLVLWYDNEWGYASRVLDVLDLALGGDPGGADTSPATWNGGAAGGTVPGPATEDGAGGPA